MSQDYNEAYLKLVMNCYVKTAWKVKVDLTYQGV